MLDRRYRRRREKKAAGCGQVQQRRRSASRLIVSENSENDESEIPYSVCNLRGARGVPLQGALPRSRALPSVLINKPLPTFELPTLFDPTQKFSTEEMKGKVWMLNVWASWCLPCKEEHPYLVGLKRSGLKTPIVGFLYKDTVGAGSGRCSKTQAIPMTL